MTKINSSLERENTLNGVDIKPGRRVGNSTRQVDRAIQILFSGKVCVVRDHCQGGHHDGANRYLFDRILKRLNTEYDLLGKRLVEFDSLTTEIRLIS